MKFDSLQDCVVVITGASSGIGYIAVEKFLREGAKVVLASRNEEEMHRHMKELGMGPDRALVVRTDVSDYLEMQNLALKAREHFGYIDVWVNNAGINAYGEVDELSVDDIRRVIDVNLMGEIHGMKAVLPIFKEQEYGNIVNMASIYGEVAAPLEAAYNASKFGIVGFSKALREELIRHYPDIEVSIVEPAGMDTPFFEHAKSAKGVEPKALPPSYHPAVAARALVDAAKNPRPVIYAGGSAVLFSASNRLMPNLLERFMARIGFRTQLTGIPKPALANGFYDWEYGPHGARGHLGSTGENIRKHPVRLAMTLAVPALLVAGWMNRERLLGAGGRA